MPGRLAQELIQRSGGTAEIRDTESFNCSAKSRRCIRRYSGIVAAAAAQVCLRTISHDGLIAGPLGPGTVAQPLESSPCGRDSAGPVSASGRTSRAYLDQGTRLRRHGRWRDRRQTVASTSGRSAGPSPARKLLPPAPAAGRSISGGHRKSTLRDRQTWPERVPELHDRAPAPPPPAFIVRSHNGLRAQQQLERLVVSPQTFRRGQ